MKKEISKIIRVAKQDKLDERTRFFVNKYPCGCFSLQQRENTGRITLRYRNIFPKISFEVMNCGLVVKGINNSFKRTYYYNSLEKVFNKFDKLSTNKHQKEEYRKEIVRQNK